MISRNELKCYDGVKLVWASQHSIEDVHEETLALLFHLQ